MASPTPLRFDRAPPGRRDSGNRPRIDHCLLLIHAFPKANAVSLKASADDVVMPVCLDYSSKILKDGWTWDGQWPESLRNMKPR